MEVGEVDDNEGFLKYRSCAEELNVQIIVCVKTKGYFGSSQFRSSILNTRKYGGSLTLVSDEKRLAVRSNYD